MNRYSMVSKIGCLTTNDIIKMTTKRGSNRIMKDDEINKIV
jgi:hypothetical protein